MRKTQVLRNYSRILAMFCRLLCYFIITILFDAHILIYWSFIYILVQSYFIFDILSGLIHFNNFKLLKILNIKDINHTK